MLGSALRRLRQPRRSPAVAPPRAQKSRPARTARPEEPEAEAPSTSPNSRHRRSANRLLIFQERKRREGARHPHSVPSYHAETARELVWCFVPQQHPPAAVDTERDVWRRKSFCMSSTCGQDMQGGKAKSRLRLDSTSRLCRASSTGIALSGRCPLGDNPPSEPSAPGMKRKRNPRPSGRVAAQHLGR